MVAVAGPGGGSLIVKIRTYLRRVGPINADAPDLRTLLLVVPGETAAALGAGLGMQRLRVVVVYEHEGLARLKGVEDLENQEMPIARCDRPNINCLHLLVPFDRTGCTWPSTAGDTSDCHRCATTNLWHADREQEGTVLKRLGRVGNAWPEGCQVTRSKLDIAIICRDTQRAAQGLDTDWAGRLM